MLWELLDSILGTFQCYREKRKGRWFKLYCEPEALIYWVRNRIPNHGEIVWREENYN